MCAARQKVNVKITEKENEIRKLHRAIIKLRPGAGQLNLKSGSWGIGRDSLTDYTFASRNCSRREVSFVVAFLANKMTGSGAKRELRLPRLESVDRITNIPIVETGWKYAENVYNRIKKSNNLIHWTFDQAESSLYTAIDKAAPAVFLFEAPLSAFDKVVCRSLDIVEERVPSINLPPQMMYYNTKQYVSDVGTKIVRPVLKRADSMKQIGNSVLSSKYTAFAADKLDDALYVADKYVDKYLPADASDNQSIDEVDSKHADGPAGRAIKTMHHMDRFSRKLQRRLTKRTLAEARALKEQSTEAIHVLIYVAELVVTDPKLALQKGRELWASLSKDEPENQARPENLEQLMVLLTRESARRIVHLVNYTSAGVRKLPRRLTVSVRNATNNCLHLVDSLIKTVHLDGVRQAMLDGAKNRANHFTQLLKQLNVYTTDMLEHFADILAKQVQQPQNKQSQAKTSGAKTTNQNFQSRGPLETLQPPANPKIQIRATHVNVANGVENVTS